MRIAFMSASRGQAGSTTASLMTALFMAMRYRKSTAFVPVSPNTEHTMRYLDIDSELGADISQSASQLYKLIEMGQITAPDMKSYSRPIVPNFDLYNMNDPSLAVESSLTIQKRLIRVLPYDHIFVDIEYPWEHENTKACVAACDMVVLVLNQNQFVLDKVADLLQSDVLKGSHVMCIVNNYNQYITDQTKVLKNPGLPKRETLFMHYNPYVMQYTNKRKIIDLMNFIDLEDWQVLELTEDLCRLCDQINIHEGDIVKGKDHKRQKQTDLPARRGGFKL